MFTAYTFPIGEQPDNESWSGFQMVSETGLKNNYLLLFRELHNKEPVKKIQLKYLAGKTIKITDLRTGEKLIKTADANGYFNFSISHAADFLWLKYEVVTK